MIVRIEWQRDREDGRVVWIALINTDHVAAVSMHPSDGVGAIGTIYMAGGHTLGGYTTDDAWQRLANAVNGGRSP